MFRNVYIIIYEKIQELFQDIGVKIPSSRAFSSMFVSQVLKIQDCVIYWECFSLGLEMLGFVLAIFPGKSIRIKDFQEYKNSLLKYQRLFSIFKKFVNSEICISKHFNILRVLRCLSDSYP